jgi:UDP-N-acetylglucosamine--dolichyl-phosphate N-acetylglucosaminephosphotransferase
MYQVQIAIIFLISLTISFLSFHRMIPALKKAGITGKDKHKPGEPEIAEMGGLPMITGISAAIITIVALKTFVSLFPSVDLVNILAVFATILLVALIGILDDLIFLPKWVKAILPLVCALPLMAIKVGDTQMIIPLVGQIDFGILYSLILVPVGITVAANVTNMLAGFNGLESGMGTVAMVSLAIIAYRLEETTALLILVGSLGALLVALYYNWYPARVFPGDVGALSIGAIIASVVIVGDFETAGVIIIIPYALDFLIKAINGFPKSFGVYRAGKLYCPRARPTGVGQLVMKLTGGISERKLTLTMIGVEAIFGAVAIWMFW